MSSYSIDEAEPVKDASGFWILRGRMKGTSIMVLTSAIKDPPEKWVDGPYETVYGTTFNVEFVQRN